MSTPETRGLRATWRSTVLGLLLVLVVPFVFYASMILQDQEPRAADTNAVKPLGAWALETQAARGEIPQWYPYIFSGMPSYGSFIYTPSSPFDPLGRLGRLAAGNRGLRYYVLFVIGGISAFFFLRRQGFSDLASAVTSLVYVMTPYFLGNVGAGHSTKLEGLCLVPTLVLALDYALARPGWWATAFLGVSGALLAWSNHPQIAYYGGMVGALYVVGVLAVEMRGRARWLPLAATFAGGALIAAGLAAVPYLAVYEYTPYSIRGAASALSSATGGAGVGLDWEYATNWSFHPRELISFVFPGWFGLQGATYWGDMPFTQSTHYFGVLPLLLALLGAWKGRGVRRWIWVAISVIVLFVGFGKHLPLLFRPLFELAPYFDRFRVPSMIYGVLPLTLAYLIAMGIDAVTGWFSPAAVAEGRARAGAKGRGTGPAARSSEAAERRRWLLATAAAVGVWIVVLVGAKAGLSAGTSMLRPEEVAQAPPAALAAFQDQRWSILARSVSWSMGLIVLGLAAGALGVFRIIPAPRRGVVVAMILGALVLVDILRVDREFYHPEQAVEAQATVPARGAFEFLQRQDGDFRVFPIGALFTSNGSGLFQVESVGGYQPAKLRIYQDLLDANLITAPSVFRMLGVSYAVSAEPLDIGIEPVYQGDGFVYPIEGALPRAWSVTRLETLATPAAVLERMGSPAFDPGAVALAVSGGGLATREFAPAEVAVIERDLHALRLRVSADGEALVVISEIHFAPGWTAEIDGAPVPIHRVNHVLRGLTVPAGTHEIRMTLRSEAFDRGMQLGWASTALVVLLVAVGAVRRRGQRTEEPPSIRSSASSS